VGRREWNCGGVGRGSRYKSRALVGMAQGPGSTIAAEPVKPASLHAKLLPNALTRMCHAGTTPTNFFHWLMSDPGRSGLTPYFADRKVKSSPWRCRVSQIFAPRPDANASVHQLRSTSMIDFISFQYNIHHECVPVSFLLCALSFRFTPIAPTSA